MATASFESTGTWTTWSTKALTVSLNAGSNTIRLDPTTATGLPNIDYLDVGAAAAWHPGPPRRASAGGRRDRQSPPTVRAGGVQSFAKWSALEVLRGLIRLLGQRRILGVGQRVCVGRAGPVDRPGRRW
ncbi:carbohydrate-binding protein [Nonomuraea polychroma]|uniref:carbohydrate-binding protein n=1 Tax=Nonomuraea polychroma TaxID=46176 RepID=UPI003D904B21